MFWWFQKFDFVRLALAAILLGIDTRLFLFFAFFLLLETLRRLDHLRALVRVMSISHDAKLVAIYEHHGIALEAVQQIGKRAEDTLDDRRKKSLRDDFALVGMFGYVGDR